MSANPNVLEKIYTVEEYFELEKHSEVRHEFYYGKLIEMAGETKNANDIANNLLELIRKPFKKKGFRVFTHDVKAEVKTRGVYRYPDLMVASNSDDHDDYVVLHPIIITEVASQDSLRTDSGIKFKEYTALTSMQHYLVISQDEMMVRMHTKDGEKWVTQILTEPEEIIDFPLFDMSITLASIYEDIVFADSQSDSRKHP